MTDGPFTESKEMLGGYWLIQVKSREEAIEWAKRVPAGDAKFVEVRQVFEMTDFPVDVQKAADNPHRRGAPRKAEAGLTEVNSSGRDRPDVHRAIDAVLRMESAKLIAGLARMVRDVGPGRGAGPGRAGGGAGALAGRRGSRTTRAPG